MAINKSAIETFVEKFGTPEAVELQVDQLNLDRTMSKKFAGMLSRIKSTSATIGGVTYTMTPQGASSMVEMLEEGESLAPAYKADGSLDLNSDASVDTVVVGGEFKSSAPVVNPETGKLVKKTSNVVKGKSIVIADATISDYSYQTFIPAEGEKTVLEGVKVDGSEGKLCAGKGPNTPLVFKTCGPVVIREMTETATSDVNAKPQFAYNSAIYNGLEIWGVQTAEGFKNPSSILIENCKFVNSFSNNAINIFGMANGAKALIKNCVFDGASNILRIGSKNTGFENSYNCVIEFRDCQFKSWDTDTLWGAFALCQFDDGDKNIYGTDANGTHITIKIVNCTGPDGQKIQPYADKSKVCGEGCFVVTKNVIDGQEMETVSKYPAGTQLPVDGTMTDVSGQDVVDTQHRLMQMYGKLPGMTAKTLVSFADYADWFPEIVCSAS